MINYKDLMWAPVRFVFDTIPLYYRIMGWKYATGHLMLQATTLLALNYMSYYTSRKANFILNNSIFAIYNNLSCNPQLDNTCSNMDPELWERFESSFYPIVPLIGMKIGISTVQYVLMKYYETTFARKISDSINQKKLSNQIAYNISKNKECDIEIGSIFPDAVLFGEAGSLMMSALIAMHNSILVLNDLIKMSTFIPISSNIYIPDVATCFLLYGLSTNFITHVISSYKAKWESDVDINKIELKAIQSYDDAHINLITISNGESYSLSKQNDKIAQIRYAHNWMLFYSSALNLWSNLHSSVYGIVKYYLFGWRVFSQTLLYEYRWGIFDTLNSAEMGFAWTNNNSDAISKIGKVSNRILSFLNEVDRQEGFKNNKLSIYGDSTSLILENVSVSNILKNISFEFKRGFYLISSESGVGKSTLLSHVANAIHSKNMYSLSQMSGGIHYTKDKKILFLSQKDFFPLNSTVLDCLYYPDMPEKNIAKRESFINSAKEMLNEINFDPSDSLLNLEEKDIKDLSGGQQKKIILVSAIMKKPDLLLLDEPFNGLDAKSKRLAFKFLKKELGSDSVTIIVDHDKTFNHMYNKVLRLQKDRIFECIDTYTIKR